MIFDVFKRLKRKPRIFSLKKGVFVDNLFLLLVIKQSNQNLGINFLKWLKMKINEKCLDF